MTHTLTNPKIVSSMLEEDGIRLSHALGQNFLVNGAIIDKIIKLAEANSEDRILEVGPGIGVLTVSLLETGATVVSIEKDARLKDLILSNTEFAEDRFSLIEGDALDFTKTCNLKPKNSNWEPEKFSKKSSFSIASVDVASDLFGGCPRSVHLTNERKIDEVSDIANSSSKEPSVALRNNGGKPNESSASLSFLSQRKGDASVVSDINKMVANLPYNIAATLVLDVFANMESIDSVTVMVQKEVAERMQAKVGTKNYGAYTVKLNLYAEACGHFFVGRNNFLPAPRVDSAVIRLNRVNRGLSRDVLQNACMLADAAFFNRRKTILNSCKAFFASQNIKSAINEDIEALLRSCNIDPKVRGERLKTQDFIDLSEQIS